MEAACARAPPPPCTSRRDFSPSRRATRPRRTPPDASDERVQFPPARASTVSVYALDCGMGAAPGAAPTVTFRATVRGSEGDVVAVRVRDGAVWTLGADGEIRGWPLDALDRTHPCTTLGDAARELGKWEHGREGARGAVAALLSRGAGSVGGGMGRLREPRAPRTSPTI